MSLLEFSERITLNVPIGDVWHFLYDTDRLNRSLGLPTVSFVPDPDTSKKGHYAAEARLGPIRLRYEEFPFEWVRNRYYRVLRRFVSGPFLEITGGVRMNEDTPGRTALEIFANVVPRHAFGAFLARLLIRKMAITGVLAQVRAFERGLLPAHVLDVLVSAKLAHETDDGYRSCLRYASLGAQLFAHSCYPTVQADAVFFGPDTYRFCRALTQASIPAGTLVDVGCGSGVGGIMMARQAQHVILADINDCLLYTSDAADE